MNATTQQHNAFELLNLFTYQRPGFDLADYGQDGYRYYRQDYRQAYNALNEYRQWVNIALRRMDGEELAKRIATYLDNNSGDRLVWSNDKTRLTYITGQYFPTEYRWAAVRIIRTIVWNDLRDEKRDDGTHTYNTGDEIRKALKHYGATRSMLN